MRARVVIFAFALALAGCAARQTAQLSALPEDLRARYHGRVVVLDFWAGWCAQCRDTVPQLRRVAAAFAAQGLVVVGINAGEDAATARAAARELGITYPILLDENLELSDRLGASQLPALLVVDADGTIVHRARKVDAATLAAIRRSLVVTATR